jgi:hypothetical protein
MVILEVFIPHDQPVELPRVFNIGLRPEHAPRSLSTVICSTKTRERAAEKCRDIARVLRECHIDVDVRPQPFFDKGGYCMASMIEAGQTKVDGPQKISAPPLDQPKS